MNELLNCPFCGGEAEMLNYSPTEWLVHCIECDGMVENWRKTKQEAIEQWNRRTPMANIVEKLEELKKPPFIDTPYHTGFVCGVNYSINIVKQEINNGLE